MKQRTNTNGTGEEEEELYMDTSEQEKVIEDLRQGLLKSQRQWSRILMAIGVLLSGFVAFYGRTDDMLGLFHESTSNAPLVMIELSLSASILLTMAAVLSAHLLLPAFVVTVGCQLAAYIHGIPVYGAIGSAYFLLIYLSRNDDESIKNQLAGLEKMKYQFKKI